MRYSETEVVFGFYVIVLPYRESFMSRRLLAWSGDPLEDQVCDEKHSFYCITHYFTDGIFIAFEPASALPAGPLTMPGVAYS